MIQSSYNSPSFEKYSFIEIEELYKRSSTMLTAAYLLIIPFIIIVPVYSFGSSFKDFKELFVTIPFIIIHFYIILFFIASIGIFYKRNWGRIMGIIAFCFMLLGFPVGTILGFSFLKPMIKSKDLFGPNRILHKDIKREYLARKAAMKK